MKEFVLVNNHNGKKFIVKADKIEEVLLMPNSIFNIYYGAVVIGRFNSEHFSYYINNMPECYKDKPIKPIKPLNQKH